MVTVPRGVAAAKYVEEHGVSLAEAARKFGVSRERVRQKWRDLFGERLLPEQDERMARDQEIVRLVDQGLTPNEIANELTVLPNVVRSVRSREGLAVEVRRKNEERILDIKRRIYALASEGKSRAEIASEVGVSLTTLIRYLDGRKTFGKSGRGREGRSQEASKIMDETGCTLTEAAARVVVSQSALFNYRKLRGLRTR